MEREPLRNASATALPDQTQPHSMLKLLPRPDEQNECARLPILTSANDIRDFVQYLKRKPAGVVAAEELDRSRRRLFDERKLEAYRNLGITEEDDHLLMLTPFGQDLAARLDPQIQGFRQLLNRNPLYISAIKWMYERSLEVVTTTDIVAFWLSLNDEVDVLNDLESSKGAAISFFSLCEAAELGTLTLGKRGHITRLNVDHEGLASFVESDLL